MSVLGVDIGGVIITQANKNDDTSFFGRDFLSTPALPGVFESLAKLVKAKFGDNAHVVSKCSSPTEQRSRLWLSHHGFYERTGINLQHVHFCHDRAGKAVIAAKLGLTDFVDNHPGVLGLMETVKNRYLFQPQAEDLEQYPGRANEFRTVRDWREAVQAILTA